MNKVTENIYTRVSVRNFKDEKVPRDTVMAILDVGCHAPSSMNRQALAYGIVENKEKAYEYSERAKRLRVEGEEMKGNPNSYVIEKLSDPDYNIFFNSPVQIFIFASPEATAPIEDGSMAAQNMMLAAHSLGYGTCFIGFAQGLGRDTEFRNDLDIPEDYTYVGALVLGRPAESTEPRPKKSPRITRWIQ
ncbi:MAG: nitroreductase family protein [Candidatus Methanomethylophilaceae archaeon]|jgi:nitroreductase